jgi:mono/diheme cytochrome c family protein
MKLILWPAAALLAGFSAYAQPGNAENGKQLFMKNGCYECHGTVGQGGTGPHLAPRPLAAAALTAYVRKPGGGMPPYSVKVMPDSDLADIRAYLATIPEPPAAKSIPLLNQ